MMEHGSLRPVVWCLRVGRDREELYAFINQGNVFLSMKLGNRGMKHKASPGLVVLVVEQIMTTMVTRICLITNHDVPRTLMRNDGTGHFTEHVLNVPLDASFAF